MLRTIFLALLLLATFVVGAAALYGGPALYRQARTLGYTATTGTVTHSTLVTDPESPGTQSADIGYTYEQDGQIFEGRVYRHGATSAAEAQDAVRARPVGATTKVYVDARNPEDAVLDAGLSGLDLLLPLFFVFASTILAYFWHGAWSLFAAPLLFALKLPDLAHCGVKATMQDARLHVRLPYYHPFVVGGTTLGLVAFATAFVAIVASGSGNAGLSFALAAWTVTLAAAVAVTVWLWHKERSGCADLVIDPAAQTIDLPALYGRKAREGLSIAEISGVAIESREHRTSRGGSYLVHCVLLRRKHGGAEVVVAWRDGECAETFAAWLRDTLKIETPTQRTQRAAG